MIRDRLPLTDIVEAIVLALENKILVTPRGEASATLIAPVFTFIPPTQGMPYLEIADVAWTDASFKNQPAKEVSVGFNAYSDDESMRQVNEVIDGAIRRLTGDPVIAIANDWAVVRQRTEGTGEVRKEVLEEKVYWRGSFRVRFQLTDQSGG